MSECREVQLGEVCYTSAGVSQTLFVTHVYDHDGSLVAVVYHDVAGVPVDTTAGVVTVGSCDCPKTFVEIVYDYDLGNGSCVAIELIKNIDCSGVATVTYLELDGTPHTVVGAIRTICPCLLDETPTIIVATTWSGF